MTAIDINPVLLEMLPAQNLSVQQMDVRTGELGSELYDLVTCRALLHHIAEYAPQVLARMAEAAKPGGWLMIQEVRDRLIAAGLLDAATIDAASALLDDPNYWTQCWMMTAVWVRKPLPHASFAAAST